MRRCFLNVFVLFFIIFLFAGCRATKYDLTKAHLKTNFQGSGKLAIGVQDLRPFVVDRKKLPTHIGPHRLGTGMPRDADTKSGKTLAEDITTILASSFTANGFQVTQFPISTNDNQEALIKQKVASFYDKIIVLTLKQFRSDSWAEVELQWEIKMSVYDGKGTLLAEKDSAGFEEGLKRNYMGAISRGQAEKAITDKLGLILVELIASPECQSAIVN
ncbi:MAG: hypothetical protein KJ630_11155 [Proteobacteria bacterium]|nr:hypothetical protein [Pseudomonadota bacterium]